MADISYAVSFMAGVSVFFSPCILPLIPSYLSYLTGISFKEMSDALTEEKRKGARILTAVHSLLFIAGFSVIFIILGMTVTAVGRLFLEYQDILKKAGALLIILFGLYIAGILKIGALAGERKIPYSKAGVSYAGSFLVGIVFALAWTPCVSPALGAILAYASTTADMMKGLKLLTVFSAGLAIPFFISGLAINSFLLYFGKIKPYIKWVNIISGAILVIFGLAILAGGVR